MKIIADANITFAKEAFSELGDVVTMPGRDIRPRHVRKADVLLVRSRTRVDRNMLEGSNVRFVGSAVIGTDHVDLPYLKERGIVFAGAPGCNANSVSEYVVAALLAVAGRERRGLEGATIGVVGVGNVGTRVAAKCEALGMKVLRNDPPLARGTGHPAFVPIDALYDADIVTFHVPLTREGRDATFHLACEAFFRRLKQGAVIVNSSRGGVVDSAALLRALQHGRVRAAVLDVWEHEPRVPGDLLDKAAIGTAHVAGYSFDGKVNGTLMIYRAACEFLGRKPTWDPGPLMPEPEHAELHLDAAARADEDVLREAAVAAYDIERDDRALRHIARLPADQAGKRFEALRRDYPVRREFQNTRVHLAQAAPTLAAKFRGLGFTVCSASE